MRDPWDTFEQRSRRMDDEFRRDSRNCLIIGGIVATIVFTTIVALIVWIVLRVT